LRCELEDELPRTVYRDVRGRWKEVRYWTMRVVGGHLEPPPDEVDELGWLPLQQAAARLSYERDRTVVQALDALFV
jgi:8-oxo-dGTP diphosphatase